MTKKGRKPITLKALLARCEPDGDCLLWQGGLHQNGYPSVKLHGKTHLVRRLALGLAEGRPLVRGDEVAASQGCLQPLCCSPAHLVRSTQAAVLAACYADGRRMRSADLLGKRRGLQTRGLVKLTMDDARAIRAVRGTATHAELAARYGVSAQTIGEILRGHTWRETVPQASVFTWAQAA